MSKREMVSRSGPERSLRVKEMDIRSDVLGSYTGRMEDPCEVPVQDADDL